MYTNDFVRGIWDKAREDNDRAAETRRDWFDENMPHWQESESDERRWVSEYDMSHDEFETEFDRISLMTLSEFAQYADNLEREREIMRDLEGWN